MNPNQYPLSEYDKTRIRPLMHQIQDKNLEFRYLITIAYWYSNKDYAKCITDAHKTRRVLRDFFKSNIRCWLFVEKHTDPSQKNYGGFHLHALVEDPSDRWENLTGRQKHWISTLNTPTPSKGTEACPTTIRLRGRAKQVDRSVGVALNPVAMRRAPGHACSPHRSTDCAVHVQTTSRQPPGGGCRSGGHLGEQCSPD
jgi:hypothetical protein